MRAGWPATRTLRTPSRPKGAQRLEKAFSDLLARPEHAWFTGNLDPKEEAKRKKAREEFQKRY